MDKGLKHRVSYSIESERAGRVIVSPEVYEDGYKELSRMSVPMGDACVSHVSNVPSPDNPHEWQTVVVIETPHIKELVPALQVGVLCVQQRLPDARDELSAGIAA